MGAIRKYAGTITDWVPGQIADGGNISFVGSGWFFRSADLVFVGFTVYCSAASGGGSGSVTVTDSNNELPAMDPLVYAHNISLGKAYIGPSITTAKVGEVVANSSNSFQIRRQGSTGVTSTTFYPDMVLSMSFMYRMAT